MVNTNLTAINLYSYWILVWVLLFCFNITNISPIVSLTLAFLYVTYTSFLGHLKDYHISLGIGNVLLKGIQIYFVLKLMNKYKNKKYINLWVDILLVTIYFVYLNFKGLSYYQLYHIDLPNVIKNINLFDYIKYRLTKIF